jgi:hypothetical protein
MKIDTNIKGIEPGTYLFRIASYPQQIKAGEFDKFQFEFQMNDQDRPIKLSFFPNQMKDLLSALGFKEVEPGVFDGDITEAYGCYVNADLYSEEYTKKDGSKGMARKLRNFRKAEQKVDPDVSELKDLAWEE